MIYEWREFRFQVFSKLFPKIYLDAPRNIDGLPTKPWKVRFSEFLIHRCRLSFHLLVANSFPPRCDGKAGMSRSYFCKTERGLANWTGRLILVATPKPPLPVLN
jgi:hypothetical protein